MVQFLLSYLLDCGVKLLKMTKIQDKTQCSSICLFLCLFVFLSIKRLPLTQGVDKSMEKSGFQMTVESNSKK